MGAAAEVPAASAPAHALFEAIALALVAATESLAAASEVLVLSALSSPGISSGILHAGEHSRVHLTGIHA